MSVRVYLCRSGLRLLWLSGHKPCGHVPPSPALHRLRVCAAAVRLASVPGFPRTSNQPPDVRDPADRGRPQRRAVQARPLTRTKNPRRAPQSLKKGGPGARPNRRPLSWRPFASPSLTAPRAAPTRPRPPPLVSSRPNHSYPCAGPGFRLCPALLAGHVPREDAGRARAGAQRRPRLPRRGAPWRRARHPRRSARPSHDPLPPAPQGTRRRRPVRARGRRGSSGASPDVATTASPSASERAGTSSA